MQSRTWRSMLAFVLILAACGQGGADTTSGTTAPGGSTGDATVRIGYGGAPADLNPGVGVLGEDFILYDLIYDSPLNLDFEGAFQPELATEWSVSDDGLTWTMKIREGVMFHDGTPLTAEDVAYSINLYRNTPDFPYAPFYVEVFTSVQAIDATTVALTTETPIGNFEYRMVLMYVLPRAIWEAEDGATFTNDAMIGSGPFKLVEYSQNEFVRLEANPDYWNVPPVVGEVIFQTISNPDARVQALVNGDVDMITEFPTTALATLQNAPNVAVSDGSSFGGRLADIFFNIVDPANCPTAEGGICSGHPALRDVAVRQALAHAVDKEQLIIQVLSGLGEPGLGLVPTALGDWFASELVDEDYQFDLDRASSLLDSAGYVDTDGDGVRECPTDDCGPTGDLTFRMNYPTDNDEHPRVADALSGWWGEIGVAVQIQGLDGDTLTSVCCPTFDYDVMLWTWDADTDPEGLLNILLCDAIPTGNSETGFCDPAYDALYKQQTVEIDPAARRELVVEMQRMILEQVPYIIPWYYSKIEAYRTDRFAGWPDQFPILSLEDPQSLNVIQPTG